MSQYEKIAQALSYLQEQQRERPSLAQVAKHVHLSPQHLQRIFTNWAGVSPKKFLEYLSVERAKKMLAYHSVLLTAHKAGLSGTGRLHDLFVKIEGMTPGEYKQGGKNLSICYSLSTSRFGSYLVASTQKGICNIFFYDTTPAEAVAELAALWPNATITKKITPLHLQVRSYFTTHSKKLLPLHVKGTSFELKVWQALLSIPEGKVTSYGQVARSIKKAGASRAVGSALAKNPIAYIIPCHRVITSLGAIGAYHWGTGRKLALIGYEGVKNP